MGLKGAPAYFQYMMTSQVLHDLVYKICEVYLDDIIVYGDSENEFLNNLKTIMKPN